MPTYQYECEQCDHAFEELQSMTDKKLRKCPECGKLKLVRLIGSGSGIIFKGTGFYETDFKTKPTVPTNQQAPKTESKAEPKVESQSVSSNKTASVESKESVSVK